MEYSENIVTHDIWVRIKLNSVSEYSKKKIKVEKLNNSNYVSTENMLPQKGGVIFQENTPQKGTLSFVEKNNILISNIRPYLKKIWFASTEASCSNDILNIKLMDSKEIIPMYLYYVLFDDKFFEYVMSAAKGTKMPRGDKEHIMQYEFFLPPLPIQNKIAKVLSDIDKKIELNNKISDNLQKLSQELYKQWFVEFEFPDSNGNPYKSTGGKMIESELGLIPEGWETGFIGDNILTKVIKSGVGKFVDMKRYVATADVSGVKINNYENICYDKKPSRANMKPIVNSVWFAKMQDSYKNILVDKNCSDLINDYVFSTGFMGLECVDNSIYYIWNYVNTSEFEILKNTLSTGTLMAGLSNSVMDGFKYVVPSQDVLIQYNNIVSSYYANIKNCVDMNSSLTQLRDTLLPKLMNGEIDLENIEI